MNSPAQNAGSPEAPGHRNNSPLYLSGRSGRFSAERTHGNNESPRTGISWRRPSGLPEHKRGLAGERHITPAESRPCQLTGGKGTMRQQTRSWKSRTIRGHQAVAQWPVDQVIEGDKARSTGPAEPIFAATRFALPASYRSRSTPARGPVSMQGPWLQWVIRQALRLGAQTRPPSQLGPDDRRERSQSCMRPGRLFDLGRNGRW